MAGGLEFDRDLGVSWAGELGRRLVAGLLALAFLAAVLVSIVATDPRGASETAGATAATGAVPAEARALRLAVEVVLAAAAHAEAVRAAAAAGEAAGAASALEDAWQSLAVVYERLDAQGEVAAGRRPPLMGAPPPAPALASRDEALVRSAMTYVRGAIEARDLTAVARARELLEMAKV